MQFISDKNCEKNFFSKRNYQRTSTVTKNIEKSNLVGENFVGENFGYQV